MVKVIDGKHSLRFSDRYFLGEEIKSWFLDNKAANCPMNVVVWLDKKNFLNRKEIRKYIQIRKIEEE